VRQAHDRRRPQGRAESLDAGQQLLVDYPALRIEGLDTDGSSTLA